MSINVHISDLFFNSQHEYKPPEVKGKQIPEFEDYRQAFCNIQSEATEFLASLVCLNVRDLPTTEQLIEDFFKRL